MRVRLGDRYRHTTWNPVLRESSLLAGEWLYWRDNMGTTLPMSDELIELDARGLECPMPLLKAKRALNAMNSGQQLRVMATDKGSVRDFQVFSEQSGHRLLTSEETDGVYIHLLQKS